ncbi:OmpA family protein [Tunturibacter empetritectus]|uniref:Peptidoglycan-associated protein n=1 Tax=Tunturiibacter lichenicola TaxID=2051959 RepID=A0A7W8JAF4_9BACT|nr:OmpA family protein [Edaphobacter lichenicola]MBB5344352.1 peptidoglycan-associated lipoprotein [Edaphobacter lichenicola]
MLRSLNLALVFVMVGVSAAIGQQRPDDPAFFVPRYSVSLGFNHMNANAPPGQSDYFGLNGGYVSGDFYFSHWLSVEGEFTGGHANDISLLGQDLTLTTFQAGPKVSLTGHRFVPYGQILFGGAHGSGSYFPTSTSFTTSATSFAFSPGGGVDINLTHRIAIRAVDANYLRTSLPNGSTNTQNHLMIGAGIVIKFGEQDSPSTPVHMVDHRPREITFTCDANAATVDAGQPLQITGHAETEPEYLNVNYTWASSGGAIVGSGPRVSVNTAGLADGTYHVTGHASLASSFSTKADCDADFSVTSHAGSLGHDSNDADPIARAKREAIFHENVQDALFDYDSADIRADAQTAIEHAAKYLQDNPSIRVLVGGYADERGSAEYNLALGEERANAARNALIAAGVDADRIQVISFGKEAQICTAETESCWQQNRRAAFQMHP